MAADVSYEIVDYQLAKLVGINRALFGDGSTLHPDKRRDLANEMFVILTQIANQRIEPDEQETVKR